MPGDANNGENNIGASAPDYSDFLNNYTPSSDEDNKSHEDIHPAENLAAEYPVTQSEAFANFQDNKAKNSQKAEKYLENLDERAQEKLATEYIAEVAAMAALEGAKTASSELTASGLVNKDAVEKQVKKFESHNFTEKAKIAMISLLVGAGITTAGFTGSYLLNNDKKETDPNTPQTTDEETTNIAVKDGDTAWNIVKAANPGASDKEIQNILDQSEGLNPGMDLDNIKPDDTINIPMPTTQQSEPTTVS